MTHPFFDVSRFPWHRPDATRLHRVLVDAIPHPQAIDALYKRSGRDLPALSLNQPPAAIWKEALENLTTANALRGLLDIVRTDGAYTGNLSIQTALAAVLIADEETAGALPRPFRG